jgi:hypothetical protein
MPLGVLCLAGVAPTGCNTSSAVRADERAVARACAHGSSLLPERPLRLEILPITVEEGRATIPRLEHGKVLKGLRRTFGGSRVEMTICMDTRDPVVAANGIRARLVSSGWLKTSLRSQPRSHRWMVKGIRPAYMLYASIEPGTQPICTSAKGQTLVEMSIYKLQIVDAPRGSALSNSVTSPPPGGSHYGRKP